MTSKKQGTSALADSANDAVPIDKTVRLPQDVINGIEFKGIDLGMDYNLSWRWRPCQPKPPQSSYTNFRFVTGGEG
jgi:hypothetical protein